MTLEPEKIRDNCPRQLREHLEFLLSIRAFFDCCGLISPSNLEKIKCIRKMYPDIDKLGKNNNLKKYLQFKVKFYLYTLVNLISRNTTKGTKLF